MNSRRIRGTLSVKLVTSGCAVMAKGRSTRQGCQLSLNRDSTNSQGRFYLLHRILPHALQPARFRNIRCS
jgi:hypothetical protein